MWWVEARVLLHVLLRTGRPPPQDNHTHVVSRTWLEKPALSKSWCRLADLPPGGFLWLSPRTFVPQISTLTVYPGPPSTRAHAHVHSKCRGFKWVVMESGLTRAGSLPLRVSCTHHTNAAHLLGCTGRCAT